VGVLHGGQLGFDLSRTVAFLATAETCSAQSAAAPNLLCFQSGEPRPKGAECTLMRYLRLCVTGGDAPVCESRCDHSASDS